MSRTLRLTSGLLSLLLLASSCATSPPPARIVLLRPAAFNGGGCQLLGRVENDGPIDLAAPATTRQMKARAAALGGNVVVLDSKAPAGDVYACRSVPAPVWVTQEGATPAFGKDSRFIRGCELVRKNAPEETPGNPDELRAYAARIGANAVILERSGADGLRSSFHRCSSLPSSTESF